MKRSTRNRAKGAGREIKGKAKAAAGRLTGKKSLKMKGRAQSALGRAQRRLGEAERDEEKELERDVA